MIFYVEYKNIDIMPIHTGLDSRGHYYQWGHHGKKYYYQASNAKQAYQLAERQARAAYYNGYRGK